MPDRPKLEAWYLRLRRLPLLSKWTNACPNPGHCMVTATTKFEHRYGLGLVGQSRADRRARMADGVGTSLCGYLGRRVRRRELERSTTGHGTVRFV